MSYLLEYWSDRSEILNTCWISSLNHVYQKSEFFKILFSFLIKTAYFTQNWNFFIRVDILFSCPSFSRVLHFLLALPSEAITIDELGSIAPKLHTYTTFSLFKFIIHEKLQVVVGYRFFFYLVYMMKTIENDVSFAMRMRKQ